MIHLLTRRPGRLFLLAVLIGLAARSAMADEVYLKGGSQLTGTIKRFDPDGLVIDTDFAEGLEVDAKKVKGINTDRDLAVTLESGDRIVGTLRYEPGGAQRLTGTSFGEREIRTPRITGLSKPGEPGPRAAEAERKLADLRERQDALLHPWTGELSLGVQGETGNTDRLAVQGRVQAERDTDLERLLLFLEGSYAKEGGERTSNEIIGGAKFERDISERWFTYGKAEIEFDEFENLDLRTTISGGLGYFLIKEEEQELKARGGLGYQHESFDNGVGEDRAIIEIGYNYRLDLNDRLRFTHGLTYYPTLSFPFSEYRLTGDAALEVPITEEEQWKLRIGVRSEYDGEPQPGVEPLDTSYFVNLVYDWE